MGTGGSCRGSSASRRGSRTMTASDGRREALRKVRGVNVQHAGLLLDKMLVWPDPPAPERSSGVEPGKEALRALLEQAVRIKVPEGYPRAFAQRRSRLEQLTGGVERGATQLRCATAKGRLVVNLGAAAARETNIALLHTWGVPYIPGSALKGLASAAAHGAGVPAWQKPDERTNMLQGEDHRLLFGDTTESGCVVFHDAWWIPEGSQLPLDLDTMTVHHRGYYQGDGSPPADHDEPNPVAFLTARGAFLIALTGPEEWVEAAFDWLDVGFNHDGIGAKTAAGYGRMSLDKSPRQREREAREEAERERREQEKKRIEARRRRLSELVGTFRGKSNARQIFEEIQRISADEALRDDVRRALRELYDKDGACWRDWLKRDANPEQQALAARFEMGSVDAPKKTAAHPEAAPTPSSAGAWQNGLAWLARDQKNRLTLYFIGAAGRQLEERNRKDVKIEEEGLEAALRAAGPDAPVGVEGQRDGKKIAAIRRPSREG
ncbi:type III-B CRISPR module RAMP protein Cmr6 [Sorangium sp. So ce1014]|uniref:type III-B CRISPR module RAMP protein Cmr6 n=1 Tax=Sorangium sp. So ce1014 TaxID=3133326 RepID=UPI003F60A302